MRLGLRREIRQCLRSFLKYLFSTCTTSPHAKLKWLVQEEKASRTPEGVKAMFEAVLYSLLSNLVGWQGITQSGLPEIHTKVGASFRWQRITRASGRLTMCLNTQGIVRVSSRANFLCW